MRRLNHACVGLLTVTLPSLLPSANSSSSGLGRLKGAPDAIVKGCAWSACVLPKAGTVRKTWSVGRQPAVMFLWRKIRENADRGPGELEEPDDEGMSQSA